MEVKMFLSPSRSAARISRSRRCTQKGWQADPIQEESSLGWLQSSGTISVGIRYRYNWLAILSLCDSEGDWNLVCVPCGMFSPLEKRFHVQSIWCSNERRKRSFVVGNVPILSSLCCTCSIGMCRQRNYCWHYFCLELCKQVGKMLFILLWMLFIL